MYFTLEFSDKRYSKAKKNNTSCPQEGLKSYLTIRAFISTSNTNPYCLIRERLEFYLLSNHG